MEDQIPLGVASGTAPQASDEDNAHPDDAHPDDGSVDEEILSEVLWMLDDGQPDALIEACDHFLTAVPAGLAEIDAAVANGAFAAAGQVAHRLRGTAGAFGALRLHRLAGDLERACADAHPDGDTGARLLGEMQVAFVVFQGILRSRLGVIVGG